MPHDQKTGASTRSQGRSQFIVAARRLFATRGYPNCKIADIAAEAGMSQGNLYWYFDGKPDLLRAVLAEGFGAIGQMIARVVADPGSPAEKLDLLIDSTLDLYEEQRDFFTIMASLGTQGGVTFMKGIGIDISRIGTDYHRQLTPLFAEARAAGFVSDIDPNVLVTLFFSFVNGLALTYQDRWTTIPRDVLRPALRRLCGME